MLRPAGTSRVAYGAKGVLGANALQPTLTPAPARRVTRLTLVARAGALPLYVRVGALVAFLLLTSQVVLLVIQLAVLRDSQGHIRRTDANASTLLETARPVAAGAKPVLRAAVPLLQQARAVIGPLGRDAAQASRAVDVLPGLAITTRELVSATAPVLAAADRLIADALNRDLVGTTLRSAADVHAALAVQRRSLAVQQRTLAVQQRTFALQARSLSALLESLRIQRLALQHVESIDRKTGGSLPPSPLPVK